MNTFFIICGPTTEFYTLSLHDALPISPDFPVCVCGKEPQLRSLSRKAIRPSPEELAANPRAGSARLRDSEDRKSTRLNSSHTVSSYAVFCSKKKSGLIPVCYIS